MTFIDDTGDGLVLHLDTGNEIAVNGQDRLVVLESLSTVRYNQVSVIDPQPRSFPTDLSPESTAETPF